MHVVRDLALVEHGQGEGRYVEDMVFPTYASRIPLLQTVPIWNRADANMATRDNQSSLKSPHVIPLHTMINIVSGTNHWSAVWIGLIAAWKQRCDYFSETPELVANPATSGCAMFLCQKQQASVPLWPCAGGGGSSLGETWHHSARISMQGIIESWCIVNSSMGFAFGCFSGTTISPLVNHWCPYYKNV